MCSTYEDLMYNLPSTLFSSLYIVIFNVYLFLIHSLVMTDCRSHHCANKNRTILLYSAVQIHYPNVMLIPFALKKALLAKPLVYF